MTEYLFYRGNLCKASEDMRPGSDVQYSQVESFITKLETKLAINKIEYEIFERAVKRFGYAVQLTDECWKATMAETTIDVEKLKEPGNILKSYFQHENVCNHGRYDTKKVLYIAFLHCKHPKRSTQERSLWGIINPQLNESITHEEATKFFEDLVMIAVDLPL